VRLLLSPLGVEGLSNVIFLFVLLKSQLIEIKYIYKQKLNVFGIFLGKSWKTNELNVANVNMS